MLFHSNEKQQKNKYYSLCRRLCCDDYVGSLFVLATKVAVLPPNKKIPDKLQRLRLK